MPYIVGAIRYCCCNMGSKCVYSQKMNSFDSAMALQLKKYSSRMLLIGGTVTPCCMGSNRIHSKSFISLNSVTALQLNKDTRKMFSMGGAVRGSLCMGSKSANPKRLNSSNLLLSIPTTINWRKGWKKNEHPGSELEISALVNPM